MTTATLEPVADRLYATPASPLPFMSGVDLRSFVIDAEGGPVIVYNTPGIDLAAERIRELGEPRRLLINHYHEAMSGRPELDVPAFVHERDRAGTERGLPIAGTFDARERLGDDLEVIPSLAHTPGTAMYLWDSGEHRFLFPGDSFWVEDGVWRAVLLGESSRSAFLDTLAVMRDLDFDVLVPWPAQEGEPVLTVVDPDERERQLAALESRIRAGASGPST